MSTPEYFRDGSSIFSRAAQAYVILVGDAMTGRLVTYEELGARMKHMPTLGDTLDRMAAWTKERGLPDLASIVVSKHRGRPSSFDEGGNHPYKITLEEWPDELAKVRKEDWFAIVPPNPNEIGQAWEVFVSQHNG